MLLLVKQPKMHNMQTQTGYKLLQCDYIDSNAHACATGAM